MSLLSFGEVFGYPVDDDSSPARRARHEKLCPFRSVPCAKASRTDPLGVCSLTDGRSLTTVCPFRFRENNTLFRDAARLVFGPKTSICVAGEIRILRAKEKDGKKIGKVDYLIAREGSDHILNDFAAIEVQSVYISGESIRPVFRQFLATGELTDAARRRPDFRSSAQKRLIPQLGLKVPVFRRWGKKFLVAVDRAFFQALPQFRRVADFVNSEITWLVYPFERPRSGTRYTMGVPEIIHTEWSDVQDALREGTPPPLMKFSARLPGGMTLFTSLSENSSRFRVASRLFLARFVQRSRFKVQHWILRVERWMLGVVFKPRTLNLEP